MPRRLSSSGASQRSDGGACVVGETEGHFTVYRVQDGDLIGTALHSFQSSACLTDDESYLFERVRVRRPRAPLPSPSRRRTGAPRQARTASHTDMLFLFPRHRCLPPLKKGPDGTIDRVVVEEAMRNAPAVSCVQHRTITFLFVKNDLPIRMRGMGLGSGMVRHALR